MDVKRCFGPAGKAAGTAQGHCAVPGIKGMQYVIKVPWDLLRSKTHQKCLFLGGGGLGGVVWGGVVCLGVFWFSFLSCTIVP